MKNEIILFQDQNIQIRKKENKLFIKNLDNMDIIFEGGLTITCLGPLNILASGGINLDTCSNITGENINLNGNKAIQIKSHDLNLIKKYEKETLEIEV